MFRPRERVGCRSLRGFWAVEVLGFGSFSFSCLVLTSRAMGAERCYPSNAPSPTAS